MTDLASIAVQIQDRALLLASERGLRDLAELERNQARAVLQHETKRNSTVRRSLLQILRARHGFELELTRVREQQEEEQLANRALQRQAARWKQQADGMEATWKHSVQELYAKHQAKRQLYQKFLERRIESRRRKTKLEQDRLEFLDRRAREMQADEKELTEQKLSVEAEARLADNLEEPEDEEVSSLAMQIKATLSKKTVLRHASQAAKEAYRKANDDMVKWESECMQQRA